MIWQFTVVEKTNRIFQLPLEMTITNYISVCIVQKIHPKNLNNLRKRISNCFSRFIIRKQCWIDGNICGGYCTRSVPSCNFTLPRFVIPYRQLIGLVYNNLKIQEVLTSRSLLDVYKEILNATLYVVIKTSTTEDTNIISKLYQVSITNYNSGYHYTYSHLISSIVPIRTIRIFKASIM